MDLGGGGVFLMMVRAGSSLAMSRLYLKEGEGRVLWMGVVIMLLLLLL